MIDLVSRAEAYLEAHGASDPVGDAPASPCAVPRTDRASCAAQVSDTAGFPVVLSTHADPQLAGIRRRPDVAELSQQGPATPDHVIRTKRVAAARARRGPLSRRPTRSISPSTRRPAARS